MDTNKNIIEPKDIKELKEKLLKKVTFKKILIYITIGVIIIMISSPIESMFSKGENDRQSNNSYYTKEDNTINNNECNFLDNYVTYLENELKQCLLNVSGVGKVEVMITIKDMGEKYIYNDTEISKSTTKETDVAGITREITTFDEKKSAIYEDDKPYLIKEELPQICGVLIISEGGDDPRIVSEINDAAKALFGIESNKIKVMKHN